MDQNSFEEDIFDDARALIEPTVDWLCVGIRDLPVTVLLTCSTSWREASVLLLAPAQARALAYELLELAEHAERLGR